MNMINSFTFWGVPLKLQLFNLINFLLNKIYIIREDKNIHRLFAFLHIYILIYR